MKVSFLLNGGTSVASQVVNVRNMQYLCVVLPTSWPVQNAHLLRERISDGGHYPRRTPPTCGTSACASDNAEWFKHLKSLLIFRFASTRVIPSLPWVSLLLKPLLTVRRKYLIAARFGVRAGKAGEVELRLSAIGHRIIHGMRTHSDLDQARKVSTCGTLHD